MNRRRLVVICAVVGCIAIGYGAALNAYFVADDFTLIAGISRGEDDAPRWSVALSHWVSGHHFESFRPLVTLALLAIYSVAGAQPIPFRLVNLVLHALVAFQIYRLTERMTHHHLAAALAALLFATNPLIVEGVTYIASLAVLLCAVFMFSGLVGAVDYICDTGYGRLAATIALALLAFASKEEALGLTMSTGVVCFATVLDAPTQPRVRRALVIFAGIVLVTAVYLVYKVTIFGRFFPGYFGELNDFPGSIAGLLNIWFRFFHPVNYLVDGQARPLALGYQALVGALCLFGILQIKHCWRYVVFCAFLFGALAAAGARFFNQGFDAGLTNGRLVYSAAAAAAILGAIACATPATRRLRPLGLSLGCGLILFQIYLTSYNNRAWTDAGVVSRTIQTESLELTGNDVTAPVYNVPDTYKGVFVDRGGWAYARLAPFVPHNRYGARSRVVTVHNKNDRPLRLALQPPHASLRASGIERPLSAGEKRRVSLRYHPTSPGTWAAQLERIREGTACSGPAPIVTITGRSAVIDRRDVWLAAQIFDVKPRQDPRGGVELTLGVVAPKNELAPTLVTVGLPPGSPWQSTVSLMEPKGEVPLPSGAVPFAGGDSRLFRIVLTPTSDTPWPLARLSVNGLNAPEVKALDPDLFVEMDRMALFPEPQRHRHTIETLKEITVGPDCSPAPKAIDFGSVPLFPPELRTGDHFTSWMQSNSEPLFWDDLAQHVRRRSDIDAMPAVFDLNGEQLARIPSSPVAREKIIEPGVLAYWDARNLRSFRFDSLDVFPNEVSWLLIEMRIAYASTFYGAVGWATSSEKEGSGWKSFLSFPDGRWRTYFIRLYDIVLPAPELRIRRLWIRPVMSGGYVEIRNIRLLHKLPDQTGRR